MNNRSSLSPGGKLMVAALLVAAAGIVIPLKKAGTRNHFVNHSHTNRNTRR